MAYVQTNLERSVDLHPRNCSALLNLHLLKWTQGSISDEQLLDFVKTKLSKVDAYVAHIMFLVVQKRVFGNYIDTAEVQELMREIEKNWANVSLLAKYLYATQDLYEYKGEGAIVNDLFLL